MQKNIALIYGDCSSPEIVTQAVRVLEEKGMRSAVIEAMMKCLDISRNM